MQQLLELLGLQDLEPSELIDQFAVAFILAAVGILMLLVLQSYFNEGRIRRAFEPPRSFELVSYERGVRAQLYNPLIVLIAAAIAYYQIFYQKQTQELQDYEKAISDLSSMRASSGIRIRALQSLARYAERKPEERDNDVAQVVIDSMRVWVSKTNVAVPCENNRTFIGERGDASTREAIRLLKKLGKRTIALDFSELKLQDADFSGSAAERYDLRQADFHTADLSGANFSFADLRGADFYCANLYEAELNDTLASRPERTAPPEGTTPHRRMETSFVQARMEWIDLRAADLTGANLIDAVLKHASLDQETKLVGADLRHAILEQLRIAGEPKWTGANLDRACMDRVTWTHVQRADVKGQITDYNLEDGASIPVDCQAPLFGKLR